MQIIRQNLEKNRTVFFDGKSYKKVWGNVSPNWISEHVKNLQHVVPGLVLDYGSNWISYNIVSGTPASEFPHTSEFVEKVRTFCINQIEELYPWVHGDWSLSNIIIDGDKFTMIDWDNLGQYPKDEVYIKMNSDLKAAFGDLYVF